MPDPEGALAAALAKAQLGFAPVKRNKTVEVKTKDGGKYTFAYAPLDTILDAVRKPLADNGLVVVQLLDDGDLVTILMHSSGERLAGRVGLPTDTNIQGLGSAITYLRRYAIQALLGIAAEEDDDGNQALGNEVKTAANAGTETTELTGVETVSGVMEAGGADKYKADFREAPDGSYVIGFKLKRSGDRDIPQVAVVGALGAALRAFYGEESVVGKHVTIRGRVYAVKAPGRTGYTRMVIGLGPDDFVETPEIRVPAPLEAESVPLGLTDEERLTEDERKLIAGGLR